MLYPGGTEPSVPEPTTTPAPTTTATTTTAAPTTTTIDLAESDTACGTLAPIQTTARNIISAPIDWVGSGAQDFTATLYETAPDTADYRLRVEREGTGSEVAIVMSPEAMALSDKPGEPTIVAAVQVDGSGDGVQPQELVVRIGNIPQRKEGGKTIAGGYDITVFFRNTSPDLPEVGCLARFADATGAELVLPIRSGGPDTAGLACDLEPDGRGGFSEFLVRTRATATKRRLEYRTKETRLRRGDVPTSSTSTTTSPGGSAPGDSTPADTDGTDGGATTSSTLPFVPVRVGGALLDGNTVEGTENDYQSPTSPFLRFSTITGCGLDVDSIPQD